MNQQAETGTGTRTGKKETEGRETTLLASVASRLRPHWTPHTQWAPNRGYNLLPTPAPHVLPIPGTALPVFCGIWHNFPPPPSRTFHLSPPAPQGRLLNKHTVSTVNPDVAPSLPFPDKLLDTVVYTDSTFFLFSHSLLVFLLITNFKQVIENNK